MATAEQIAELRESINEPTAELYTDQLLGQRIDELGSVTVAAAYIWRKKAGRFAELVDIQEGSSRRALGDLHEQALTMAQLYEAQAGGSLSGGRRATTRPIERP